MTIREEARAMTAIRTLQARLCTMMLLQIFVRGAGAPSRMMSAPRCHTRRSTCRCTSNRAGRQKRVDQVPEDRAVPGHREGDLPCGTKDIQIATAV